MHNWLLLYICRKNTYQSAVIRSISQCLAPKFASLSQPQKPEVIYQNVVVVKEKETPPLTDIMGEVVTTLPKALQEKGRQLVSRLKTTRWNDRGELLHEGVVVPGSNVVDLVHDLQRKRKTSDPIGWQQFGSQMRAANIHMKLVGNVARRRHIQQRKRTLTPKQKKGRRVQLPDDWESY